MLTQLYYRQDLSSIIIVGNNHKTLYYFIIEIKLTHIYYSKLFSTLRYPANKYNNVMKLANWKFFLPDLELFFFTSTIDQAPTTSVNKNFFIFSIQKSLSGDLNNVTNVIKAILFFDKIRPKFLENRFNASVIVSGIIKNKVSKFFLKAILLNNLYYLFHNDFI